MVGPSEGSVRSRLGFVNIEVFVGFWKIDASQGRVVREISKGLHFFNGEACRGVSLLIASPEVIFKTHH